MQRAIPPESFQKLLLQDFGAEWTTFGGCIVDLGGWSLDSFDSMTDGLNNDMTYMSG